MANVKIDVQVVTNAANASLKKVSVQAGKTEKSFKELNKSTVNLGKAAVVAGAAFGAFIFGKLIKGAVDSASRLEDLNTKFTTLTGSASKAKDLFEELAEFSTVTPFELNDLAEAGGKLLAFGFASTEVKDRLTQIGDVSAAVGTDLGGLATIFGQVANEGKLTGERLAQLQDRGVPIGKALADAMGVPLGSIKKLGSEGKITFDIFDKAFQSLSQKGGPAFEGMITQSKTLSGLISTLKGNFDLFLGTLGQKILPAVKATVLAFTSFIDVIQNNKDAILGALGGLAVAVGILTAKFVVMKVQAALAWAAAAAPATLVIVAIAAVGAGIGLLIKNWEEVKIKSLEFYSAAIDGAIKVAQAVGLSTASLERHKASIDGSIEAHKLQLQIQEKQRELELKQDEERKRIDKETAQREREANARQEEASKIRNERLAAEAAEEKARMAEKLADEEKLFQSLFDLRDQLRLQQQANRLLETEEDILFKDERLIRIEEFFTREEEAEIQAGINSAKNQAEAQKLILQAQIKGEKARLAATAASRKATEALEKNKNKAVLGQTSNFFGAAASLAQAGGAKNFKIAKAFSLAQATTSGILAVQNALALQPYPVGLIAGAAATVQTLANLSRISSTKPPAFEQGGIVPGSSFSGDNVSANVNSGEMILNREQQNNLFSLAQSGGIQNGGITNITVELDGEVVGRAVSRQVRDGLELGEIA